ncbi:MAG: hypothetical protein AAF208_03425 [Cyanobacteria bacterium P01_A01_bin.45]
MTEFNPEKTKDIQITHLNRRQLSNLYLALTGNKNFRDKISHIESNYIQGTCRQTFYLNIDEPNHINININGSNQLELLQHPLQLKIEEKGYRNQEVHYDIVFSIVGTD